MKAKVKIHKLFTSPRYWTAARCPCCPDFLSSGYDWAKVMAAVDKHLRDRRCHRGH